MLAGEVDESVTGSANLWSPERCAEQHGKRAQGRTSQAVQ